MRMIVMGLNITICTREEKEAKRDALLDYLIKHVKVCLQYIYIYLYTIFQLSLSLSSATNCTPYGTGPARCCASSTSSFRCI